MSQKSQKKCTMAKRKSDYAPGENPTSLENLKPRETFYDECKKRWQIMVTPTGWAGFKELAQEVGLSASELIEQIGRREIEIKGLKQHKK
jgi:hypothetical protein